jgi:drug/metabolite transporter (DMT)-like permease
MNRRRLALTEALLVTIIWSSTFVIVKIGLESLGPLTIAGLRYLIGSLVLAPFLLFRRSSRAPVSKELWLKLILIGISAYTIGNGALFWGLKFIPATTGSFLMSMIPLLVLFGGAILLKEIPTRWQIMGVILSLFGSGLFFSSGLMPGEPQGVVILAIGLLGIMAFSLLGRGIARDKQLDTLRLTTLPLIIGGGVSLLLAFAVEGLPLITWTGFLIVSWLAIINTAGGYLLYNHALQELTALEMNMVMNLSPIFTALLGWILLGETLSLIQIIGMLVVIGGVILVQRSANPETAKI